MGRVVLVVAGEWHCPLNQWHAVPVDPLSGDWCVTVVTLWCHPEEVYLSS